jgi:hypothetical protein
MAITLDGTAGVTIGASSNYTFGDTSTQGTAANSGNFAFKNRIINGAMVIDQRNAGASLTITNTAAGTYTVDRWQAYGTQASKFSVQQNAGSVTPPAGYSNYAGITSLSAYSVLSTDRFQFGQAIEGFNAADLAFGTANAATVTLSFWVRSSLTGTFGGSLGNSTGTRNYPFTFTISSANTWEQKSVTIAGDTTGTWVGATNGIGLYVIFGLGAGSTLSGTAGAWTTTFVVTATGAVSVVGTNAATFYITGVQLEKNSVATAFDVRPYGTELQLCQRYYSKSYALSTVAGTATNTGAFMHPYTSATGNILRQTIPFKVTMRAAPTVSIYGGNTGASGYWQIEGAGTTNQAAAGVTFISENNALVYSTNNPAAGHYYFNYVAESEL